MFKGEQGEKLSNMVLAGKRRKIAKNKKEKDTSSPKFC